jgi:hypothetical protein
LWRTFASKSKVINIINNTVLENIKAYLQSGDGYVTLKFTNKEDKSKKGSGINRENDGNKENKSKESSKIDKENNSKSKNN